MTPAEIRQFITEHWSGPKAMATRDIAKATGLRESQVRHIANTCGVHRDDAFLQRMYEASYGARVQNFRARQEPEGDYRSRVLEPWPEDARFDGPGQIQQFKARWK